MFKKTVSDTTKGYAREKLEDLLYEKIEDTPPSLRDFESFYRLVEYYKRIHGFMAGHLAEATDIISEMVNNAHLRALSFTANLVATGIRGLLALAIRKKMFDVIVTTTGTIDHDIAKSLSQGYYKGSFFADDDSLNEMGIYRLGNIFIPKENYGRPVETLVEKLLEELRKDNTTSIASYELLWKAGSMIEDKNSILKSAFEARVPIIVPGFYDGAFGTNVYWLSKIKGIRINLEADQRLMEDMFFKENITSGALIIGGGISKHHLIWWSQFSGGLDYAVYVTTAVEYDGSLSGAHPREAVSWGKIKSGSKKVVVYGDATLIIPLILSKAMLNHFK